MNGKHWQDWLIALIGVWLIASNWLLSYSLPPAAPAQVGMAIFWNASVSGFIAILLGAMALTAFRFWEEWADIVLGLWLVASPWVLGFADVSRATWNVVLSGLVIMLTAAWTLYDAEEATRA